MFAYLEEDCDMGNFLKALDKLNVAYKIIESKTCPKNSSIRNYESFRGIW